MVVFKKTNKKYRKVKRKMLGVPSNFGSDCTLLQKVFSGHWEAMVRKQYPGQSSRFDHTSWFLCLELQRTGDPSQSM